MSCFKLELVLVSLAFFFLMGRTTAQKSLRDATQVGYFYEKPADTEEENLKVLEVLEEEINAGEEEVNPGEEVVPKTEEGEEEETLDLILSTPATHLNNEYVTPVKDSHLKERAIAKRPSSKNLKHNFYSKH